MVKRPDWRGYEVLRVDIRATAKTFVLSRTSNRIFHL
jgi:hypothetical protein